MYSYIQIICTLLKVHKRGYRRQIWKVVCTYVHMLIRSAAHRTNTVAILYSQDITMIVVNGRNLFVKMGAILRGVGLHILSLKKSELSQCLHVVWTNILLDYLQNLVESMSDRMKQSKM